MYIFANDINIVYSISSLLVDLTDFSYSMTKIITLNASSQEKIFKCLESSKDDIAYEILKLIYNCYITDEDTVNVNMNIGVYVFNGLNQYALQYNIEESKNINNSSYFWILISFLDILINEKTNKVYKNWDSNCKNNIISILLILCRDVIDENLKLDAHAGLKNMLDIIKEPEELNIKQFGICDIVSTFLPHIKLESNNPNIVLYSLQILDKFSYLCDTRELIKLDLINQIEQILLTLFDMNENRNKPKSFYKNFTKAIIGDMLTSISYIISNAMADDEDSDEKNEWEDYIINQTRIFDYFTLCLKIPEIEEENLVNIYTFFKDFLEEGIEKERLIKLILSNFIEIGIVESLKNNIISKKFEVIQEILNISVIMMKSADKLRGNQDNFIKIYLEKKGFYEMLTTIGGIDFGNSSISEMARNIQENFFKMKI